MPFGELSLGLGLAPAGAASGFTPYEDTLYWDSVRLPPFNGEDKTTGTNGGLYLPGSKTSLTTRSVIGDAPLLASNQAIGIISDMPFEVYNGLNRPPGLIQSYRALSASTQSRNLTLNLTSGGTNNANARKMRLIMRGESADSAGVDMYSSTIPSPDRYLYVPRIDTTHIVIDMWNCRTGTKTAGTPVAKPSGWAGIKQLGHDLSLGVCQPTLFPQDATDFFNNNIFMPYMRGELARFIVLDAYGDDADWAAFAQGADPMAISNWSSAVRCYAALTSNGALDLSVQENLASPVSYTSDLVQLGTLLPGSTLTGQSASTSLVCRRLPDPQAVNIRPGQTSGKLRVVLDQVGLTDEDVEMRVIDEDAFVQQEWATVGTLSAASNTIDVTVPAVAGNLHLEFRAVTTGTRCTVNVDVQVGWGIVVNGQSQANYTFDRHLKSTGTPANTPTTVNTQWGDAEPGRCNVICLPPDTMTLKETAIYRAPAEEPGLIGDGPISFFNQLAAYTDLPIHLYVVAVQGTTMNDMLANAGSPDSRDMSDVYDIIGTSVNLDENGKAMISTWLQWEHSSNPSGDYANEIIAPMLDGMTTSTITTVDDYPLSGLYLENTFDVGHFPANRTILTTVTDHDDDDCHLTSWNIWNNESVGYTALQPLDLIRIDGDNGTHPEPDDANGSAWGAKMAAYAAAHMLNLSDLPAGVSVASAVFTDGTRNAVDVTFTSASAFTLNTNEDGTDVYGFEVDDSNAGFSATITGATTVRLTKDSGAWSEGSTLTFKTGGPGDYGGDHANWFLKGLVYSDKKIPVRPTAAAVTIAEAA